MARGKGPVTACTVRPARAHTVRGYKGGTLYVRHRPCPVTLKLSLTRVSAQRQRAGLGHPGPEAPYPTSAGLKEFLTWKVRYRCWRNKPVIRDTRTMPRQTPRKQADRGHTALACQQFNKETSARAARVPHPLFFEEKNHLTFVPR